jgi:prepilin-type N-terminal cleavage/methylation domain-containing protein
MFHNLTLSRAKRGDKSGFTLAEVLLTLLIIGVVASLVIPGIIADTQEQELKTAWKKAYATISNAARLQLAEEDRLMFSLLIIT